MKERILLIDDDELVRTGLADNLGREGFDVVSASSGAEALRFINADHADVAICDLVLGDADGMELLHHFQERCPEMAVVMITGHGSVRNALEALRGGASDYIQKPADPEEVIHRVRMVLDGAKLRQNLQDERAKSEERKRFFRDQLIRSDRMSSLSVLADGAASDLQKILEPVLDLPERMTTILEEHHPAQEDLRALKDSLEKALAVIQDMHTIGNSGSYRLRSLSVNELVGNLMDTPEYRKVSLTNSRIRLEVDLDPSVPMIKGSDAHLSQALANLYLFACESLPGGGVVRIETGAERPDLPVGRYGAGEEGDYVVIRIHDSAMRLHEQDVERLFEPFYVRDKMGRQMISGLGLTLVYRVVDDHGGFIDLLTEEGHGNVFAIYLPVTGELETESLELRPDYTGQETILVVDDSEAQRDQAVAILESLGYRALAVADGHEAVSLFDDADAEDSGIDLAVIDLVLGDEFDGVETFKKIVERCPGQRAVLASGFSDISRIVEAKKLGILSTLQKPYSMENLGKTIRQILDGS